MQNLDSEEGNLGSVPEITTVFQAWPETLFHRNFFSFFLWIFGRLQKDLVKSAGSALMIMPWISYHEHFFLRE
jgi:hypothetical protein